MTIEKNKLVVHITLHEHYSENRMEQLPINSRCFVVHEDLTVPFDCFIDDACMTLHVLGIALREAIEDALITAKNNIERMRNAEARPIQDES